MRAMVISVLLSCSAPAWCNDIVDVLTRSQAMRMQALTDAAPDSARAATVRASFKQLVATMSPPPAVEMRVVTGPLYAEAVQGRLIVASEAVADLPEGERLLMLGHELGHITLGHWDELCRLYLRHVPGEVLPETTDPVAGALGLEAHVQAHRHEFDADAYGYGVVRELGYRIDTAYGLMMRLGSPHDTATHPGTRRRVAHLRELDGQLERSAMQATAAAAPRASRTD
jgi:Zn-dependent protease with chaperone function